MSEVSKLTASLTVIVRKAIRLIVNADDGQYISVEASAVLGDMIAKVVMESHGGIDEAPEAYVEMRDAFSAAILDESSKGGW